VLQQVSPAWLLLNALARIIIKRHSLILIDDACRVYKKILFPNRPIQRTFSPLSANCPPYCGSRPPFPP